MDDNTRLLGRIEERTESISDDVREIKLMLQVQNGRIRDLERKSDKVDGGWKSASVAGGVMATITSLVISVANRWL